MIYKNTFINHYLRIKIYTNSKRIHKLINNFLDLNNSFRHSKPKIKIDFYLDEIRHKNPIGSGNFVYQSRLGKNKTLLSSFGGKLVSVTTDLKARIVRGAIYGYKESFKEHILHFTLIQPLRLILAQYGFFFLHTSVVCKGKDCILISGPQDSGKSTLALILAQNGFELLADDDCLVKFRRSQIQLFPFPTKMGLNDRFLKNHPELAKHTLKNYRFGGKRRLSLRHLSNSNNAKGLKYKMIILPKYQAKRNIYMKRIPGKKVFDRLVKENPILYSRNEPNNISSKGFWTLHALARNANSFELIYNDDRLNEIPEIVQKVFADT